MTAFFVSRIRVKSQDKLQEYAQSAGPTVRAHQGKVVLQGAKSNTLLGDEAGDHITAIAEFPSLDVLNAWFDSPEYQALTDLRDQAGDAQIVTYEVPTP